MITAFECIHIHKCGWLKVSRGWQILHQCQNNLKNKQENDALQQNVTQDLYM